MKKQVLILLLILTIILIIGCKEKISDEEITPPLEIQEEEQPQEEIVEEGITKTEEPQLTEEILCESTDKLLIGDYCCKYPEGNYILCDGEIDRYLKRKNEAYAAPVTSGKINHIEKLYFLEPEAWHVAKSYTMGGMDVPITYFITAKERTKNKSAYTQAVDDYDAEIRIFYHKNEESLSLEEFKNKIVSIILRERTPKEISNTFDKVIPEIIDGLKSTYDKNLKSTYDERKGLEFRVEDPIHEVYKVLILEYKGSFFGIISIMIMEDDRKVYKVYTKDSLDDEINDDVKRLFASARIIEGQTNTHEFTLKSDQSIIFPLPVQRDIKYGITSTENIYMFIFKNYKDARAYAKEPKSKPSDRSKFYEDCQHKGITKIETATCKIDEEGWMVISRIGEDYADISFNLDWS